MEATSAVQECVALMRVAPDVLTRSSAGPVAFFAMQSHLASATAIRSILAQSDVYEAMKRLDGWLPQSVSAYIIRQRLYGVHAALH